MNRILAPAEIAHYEPWPVELSTLPASHSRRVGPCARNL
jgi:hypothetical protein